MKTFPAIFMRMALVAAAAAPLQAQTPVRITANNVNLRAQPRLNAEVVTQAHYDERLVARTLGEEWIEVAAPATADLWILKEYIQQPQNTIGANRVNVRAGPGIAYSVVDTLELGDPVEPRGEELQGWLKIAPPPNAFLWVSREYVEIPDGTNMASAAEAASADDTEKDNAQSGKTSARAKQAAATAAAPVPALPTPIVSPSVPVSDSSGREIPVPPPANLKLIPLAGQGRFMEVTGKLRAAPLINEAPTRYRVVRWQNNRWQVLCHVYGEATKFRSLQDKTVRLKGREYWIQGAAAPVLVPDQIEEIVIGE